MGKGWLHFLTFLIITACFVNKDSVCAFYSEDSVHTEMDISRYQQKSENTEDVIAEGVYIEHIDMSGKTYHEAETELLNYVEHLSGQRIECGGENGFSMTLNEAGLYAEVEKAVQDAVRVGREGYLLKRWQAKRSAKKDGVYIELLISCDRSKLEAALNAKSAQIFKAPKDAVVRRISGQMVVEESQNGQKLDVAALVEHILSIVEHDWNGANIYMEMPVINIAPAHTTEEVAVISDLIGAYKTSFAGSPDGRVLNIKNGAAKLENHVVYPGEEFSFLSMMVPFSYENGYAMAGTYKDGRQVDGIGGGICQVSSTLYNAVLRAELTVTARSNHMMTVGYVPLGADATIANPSVDFRFRNDMDTPILIESYTSGTTLYVNIYGVETRPQNREVTFVSVVEETMQPGADVITYDDSKPSSYREVTQSAHVGYVAAFYKNVYEDGQLVSQSLINRSRYGAYPAYVIQGTK